ncbi:hypothetical protein [Kaistella palustris]|uniref:hypothetical protein n=1 Tax=Kaistella palustris TaxID=493376 RepID=UPI0004002D97|nr:hypothetical protein [Kaistella palustris]
METIQIQAAEFFEFLKAKDTSMWEIFAQMIDGTEKKIVFLEAENRILFTYTLPENEEKLNEDRQEFAKEYAEKLSGFN